MDKEEMKEVAQEMAKALADALKPQQNEWEQASRPFKSEEEKAKEQSEKLILKPNEETKVTKKLESEVIKTDTFLDNLYGEGNLGGIPFGIQIGITGLPSSGKSILIEEIAVRVASMGKHVLLITSEDAWSLDTPRMDLQNRCKQKADILKLDWDKIKENLWIIDAVTFTELRDWETFAQTYRFVCKNNNIELVLFDSLTMLESYRGNLKYRLQEITKFNQLHGVTAIFINQRAKEEWDVREMAGGIGLGHILDSTMIIDYGRTYHEQIRMDLEVKRGVDVKIVRVLGCRLCAFDGKYHKCSITSDGFLRLVEK